MSFLYGAFTFAYAVFEVPTGWLGDRYGVRRTLIRIVLWWSVFTALTGTIYPIVGWPAFAFPAMLAIRFLFGVGEAGAYPNIAHAFHNWFPFTERGSAKGAMWMAGRFAGGVTPFVVLALISEATIDGPGSVDLSVAGNLTSLVKYDAKLDEHHAAIDISANGLKINGKPVRAGDTEIVVQNRIVVPVDAVLVIADAPVLAGKL